MKADPIACDIEHGIDFDEEPAIYIRREDDQGVIEIRGLENIVLLRFGLSEWDDLFWGVNEVYTELEDCYGKFQRSAL